MHLKDLILPFQLEKSNLRGRVVRLSGVLDHILTAHNYPKPVSHLVGESVTLSLALSSMLKFDGVFTLQTSGDGPISMLVADVESPAQVRACAKFNEERVAQARQQLQAMAVPETSQNHLAQYLGKGYLAFTVDPHGEAERYQGIVALEGASLVDCVQDYFRQSEQIDTAFRMAVGHRGARWQSAAIMLQKMPEEGGPLPLGNTDEDDWRRAMILMQSATENELLDDQLSLEELLVRLFHEEGVRVFEPVTVAHACRCSLEKVQDVVTMLPEEDRAYVEKDGAIEMICEFCSKAYRLDPKTLEQIL